MHACLLHHRWGQLCAGALITGDPISDSAGGSISHLSRELQAGIGGVYRIWLSSLIHSAISGRREQRPNRRSFCSSTCCTHRLPRHHLPAAQGLQMCQSISIYDDAQLEPTTNTLQLPAACDTALVWVQVAAADGLDALCARSNAISTRPERVQLCSHDAKARQQSSVSKIGWLWRWAAVQQQPHR